MDKSRVLFTPEGVRDLYKKECIKREIIKRELVGVMEKYAFNPIKTPMYEFFDIFNQEKKSAKSNEIFKFFDQYNNTLCLRPDITPSVARCVSKYDANEDMPIKLYYVGSTFLHRLGYQGKLAEIEQIGVEFINDSSSDADAEMIAMAAEMLIKAGLDDFQIDVGHADFIRGIMDEAHLNDEEKEQYLECILNKNTFAVEKMLENIDMSNKLKKLLIKIPNLFGSVEILEEVKKDVTNILAINAIERMEHVYEVLTLLGVQDHITFDLGMQSRYGYYTGIIFKAYTYGSGEALVNGGRYDDLMQLFGKDSPAIGFAVNVDLLMDALGDNLSDDVISHETVLVLYRSGDRKKALEIVSQNRALNKPVMAVRKNKSMDIEDYKAFAGENFISKIIYVDENDVKEIAIS